MVPKETLAFFQSLRNHIAAHPPDFGDGDARSILEMLFCHYNEFNRFDTEAIKLDFDTLYARIDELHLRDMDKIIDIVCSLCREHEKVSRSAPSGTGAIHATLTLHAPVKMHAVLSGHSLSVMI